MSHGMSPQERGRRGAEARWKKVHEQQGNPGAKSGSESDREVAIDPSQRVKKDLSHGMSAHDRGVLGAQARWAKAHGQIGAEAGEPGPEKTPKTRGA
jgi:hypothetical protein